MSRTKLITQIDITCNIAFLDICNDSTQSYLLCCTGQQYPEYPCFGDPQTGFAQHSSICRAALASGVQCGKQFFAFFVGENCRFKAFKAKGVVTFAYGEWSKAYKIKEVGHLFSEHKKLVHLVEERSKSNEEHCEKIRDLQFEIERLKREKDLLQTRTEEMVEKNSISEEENCLLKKANDTLKKKLDETKTFPFSEHKRLKEERKVLITRVNVAEKSKIDLKMNTESKIKILGQLQKRHEIQSLKAKRIKEARGIEKEITNQSAASALEKSAEAVDEVFGVFCERRAESVKQRGKSTAMTDMKEIFRLLSTLKTVPDDMAKDENDGVPMEKEKNLLEKAKLLPGTKFSKCKKEALKQFSDCLGEFDEIYDKEHNLARDLIVITKSLLESVILSPCQWLENNLAELESSKENLEYEENKAECQKLQDALAKFIADKNITEALKATSAVQEIIRAKIIPLNDKICGGIKKRIEKKISVGERDSLKAKKTEISNRYKTAESDLESLEKMSPIQSGKITQLESKCVEKEKTLKKGCSQIGLLWEKLHKMIQIYQKKVLVQRDNQLEFYEMEIELEAMRFKILRWEEGKGEKKAQLEEFIANKGKEKDFVAKLEQVLTSGVECLLDLDTQRLSSLKKEEGKLLNEKEEIAKVLYNSLCTDLRNKTKQIKRLESMKKALEDQLDEAMELMDEEAVLSLKEQIEKLPRKAQNLETKIEVVQKEIGGLEKSLVFLKGCDKN